MIEIHPISVLVGSLGTASVYAAKFSYKIHREAVDDRETVEEIRSHLESNVSWHQAYVQKLRSTLTFLDRYLDGSPLGPASYGACLRFSIAYMLTSVLFIWFVSGHDASGISEALPGNITLPVRFIAVICCALATYTLFSATRAATRNAILLSGAAIVLSCAGSFVVGGVDFAVVSAVTSAAVVSAIYIFVPAPGVAKGSYPATAHIFLKAGMIGLIVGIAAKFIPVMSSVSFWSFSIGAAAIASATTSYVWTWSEKNGHAVSFYWLASTTLAGCVVLTFLPITDPFLPKEAKLLAVFWVLLPILNTPFDWFSLGTTRIYLAKTVAENGRGAIKNAIADVVLSSFLLVLLSVSVTIALCSINFLCQRNGWGRPIEIASLLEALREDPISWDRAWIYIMVGSTFLPTVVHLGLAAFAISTWALRKKIAAPLGQVVDSGMKSTYHKTLAAVLLTLRDVVSYAIPAVILLGSAFAIFFLAPEMGRGLLWCCEFAAYMFGEPLLSGQGVISISS